MDNYSLRLSKIKVKKKVLLRDYKCRYIKNNIDFIFKENCIIVF